MRRILIAEDESHIAHVLSVWLRRHGFRTLEARNGALALKLLETETVDLIISDMNMPVMDGLGFVREVREKLGEDIPILMLSARCDQGRLGEQLKPYHVQLYPKPFMPSQLVAEIERLLGMGTEQPDAGSLESAGAQPCPR